MLEEMEDDDGFFFFCEVPVVVEEVDASERLDGRVGEVVVELDFLVDERVLFDVEEEDAALEVEEPGRGLKVVEGEVGFEEDAVEDEDDDGRGGLVVELELMVDLRWKEGRGRGLGAGAEEEKQKETQGSTTVRRRDAPDTSSVRNNLGSPLTTFTDIFVSVSSFFSFSTLGRFELLPPDSSFLDPVDRSPTLPVSSSTSKFFSPPPLPFTAFLFPFALLDPIEAAEAKAEVSSGSGKSSGLVGGGTVEEEAIERVMGC